MFASSTAHWIAARCIGPLPPLLPDKEINAPISIVSSRSGETESSVQQPTVSQHIIKADNPRKVSFARTQRLVFFILAFSLPVSVDHGLIVLRGRGCGHQAIPGSITYVSTQTINEYAGGFLTPVQSVGSVVVVQATQTAIIVYGCRVEMPRPAFGTPTLESRMRGAVAGTIRTLTPIGDSSLD